MLTWVSANAGTLVVLLIVLLAAIAAGKALYKQKKSGHNITCGGNCAGCPMGGKCHASKPSPQ